MCFTAWLLLGNISSHLLPGVSSNWPQPLTGVSDLLETTLDYSSRWLERRHISRGRCIKMNRECF